MISLSSISCQTSSVQKISSFMSGIFDLEMSIDQRGPFVEFEGIKLYWEEVEVPQFCSEIQLKLPIEIDELSERINFLNYRAPSKHDLLKFQKIDHNILKCFDFDGRSWLITSSM